jgi:hypothetical protein
MKACVRQYSTNFSDTRGQLAMMPGVFNPITNFLSFFATNPFLILGLLEVDDLPTVPGPTQYPNSKFVLRSNAIQNTNSEWIQALFIAMGFANAQPEGASNGMTAYNTPGSAAFSEYMYKYLNPDIIGAWYNTYVMPGSEIIQFWADELALADPNNTNRRFRALAQDLFNNASLPLYNPPGLYEINLSGVPFANTEPYHDGLAAYLAANLNEVFFVCEQQNSPDLFQSDQVPNPFLAFINSINFTASVPDAILWT